MCLNNTVKLVYYAGEHGYSEYRITRSFYESPVKFCKNLCKLSLLQQIRIHRVYGYSELILCPLEVNNDEI